MPFTLAHPAAAIPFLRTRLVAPALVIGCMVPDFEYFLRFAPEGGFGHSLPGVFLFDLPGAFIVLWLYHAYIKEPLYLWLPVSVQRRIRLGPAALGVKNFAQFLLVLLSILVGVATHILWDSFTHRSFWPYHHWQFLHRVVLLPVIGHIEILRVIQHVSTIVGFAVLLLWFRHWYRKTAPTQPVAAQYARRNRRASLVVIAMVALAAAALSVLLIPALTQHRITEGKILFECAVITAIDVFCLGVLAYGMMRAMARSKPREA
jgi:hypothetical protein